MKKQLKKIIGFLFPVYLSKYLFFKTKNKKLNLKNPVWFNEKLMWLKLNNYNKNPLVMKCADKYAVREYLTQKGIPSENQVKILFIYKYASEIDFNILPSKFALKCSHGCGFNIICENKKKLDFLKTRRTLKKWLKTKFGYDTAQLHYNHVKPVIICEEFIENTGDEFPIDYKIYCFNGIPRLVLVCTNRKEKYQTSFYDLNWKRIKLRKDEAIVNIQKPKSFNEMIKLAKILAKDFPFVRIDFYEHKGKAIIGELTFTPAACLGNYTEEAELLLGSWLQIDRR